MQVSAIINSALYTQFLDKERAMLLVECLRRGLTPGSEESNSAGILVAKGASCVVLFVCEIVVSFSLRFPSFNFAVVL